MDSTVRTAVKRIIAVRNCVDTVTLAHPHLTVESDPPRIGAVSVLNGITRIRSQGWQISPMYDPNCELKKFSLVPLNDFLDDVEPVDHIHDFDLAREVVDRLNELTADSSDIKNSILGLISNRVNVPNNLIHYHMPIPTMPSGDGSVAGFLGLLNGIVISNPGSRMKGTFGYIKTRYEKGHFVKFDIVGECLIY